MSMLVLTEDQELLADNANDVVRTEAPVSRLRSLHARRAVLDEALWAQLTELGWPAIPFAEDDGGLGMGLPEVAILMEALGRNLVATPMVSAVLASHLDPAFGAQQGRILALAWREDPRRSDPSRLTAQVTDGRLTGRKIAVEDARSAEAFVVSALHEGSVRLFRVDAAHARLTPLTRVDLRDAADVTFDAAPCTRLDGDLGTLQTALRHGAVAYAAEALGAAEGVFALTKAYLHERHQFDQPIGSFQAIQHRMVDVFVQLELARSAVLHAARVPEPSWVRLASVKASEALWEAVKEAVQLHGGIGMTEECDVGLYVKRAMVLRQTLGWVGHGV